MSRPRGRGRRRRQHAAAGQDRHHHAGQPAGDRVRARRRRRRRGAGRRGAAVQPRRRDAGGPLDRRVRQAAVRAARARTPGELDHAHWVAFTAQTRMSGVDLTDDGRRRQVRKGAASAVAEVGARQRRPVRPTSSATIVDGISAAGGTPLVVGRARRRPAGPGARRHPPQGRRQAGHARAVRRDAPDGHPHGDDHRRQPADRQGHRRRGRRRRLPRRGHARGQDGADQEGAGGRQAGRDDRRRHQRRARRWLRPTSAWR